MAKMGSDLHSVLSNELSNLGKPEFRELCKYLGVHPVEEAYPSQYKHFITERDIARVVYKYFPTYFASAYQRCQALVIDNEALFDHNGSIQVSNKLEDTLHKILELRDLLLDFLPFLFMVSLNRMSRASIEKIARNQLIRSVNFYEKVYHHNTNEIDRGLQLRLLLSLLDLFRTLDREKALTESFILHPLLDEQKSFNTLFPQSLDTCLQTLEFVRALLCNDSLTHLPDSTSNRINQLSRYALDEIIHTLTPIFENFFLVYLDKVDISEGSQFRANGYVFAGVEGPTIAEFLVETGYRADYDKLEVGNLYLINRIHELSQADTSEGYPLTPNDYLNLTPFVLYTIALKRNPSPETETGSKQKRDLFVFYSFEAERTLFRFLGLDERRIMRIRGIEQSDYWYLFEEYDIFLKHYKGLLADIERDVRKIRDAILPKEVIVSLEAVQGRTWEISLDHLASVLQIENYDKNGAWKNETEIGTTDRFKYNEALYVPTSAEEILDRFYRSGKAGIFLIGKAGIGKTNLLCANYLRKRREGELVLFLDARRFNNSDIRDTLAKAVAQRIFENWNLGTLNEYLANSERNLSIYIDAVNEYSGPGGPIAFLQELINFVGDAEALSNLKIIASCRSETWFQYREAMGLNIPPLNSDRFYTNHNDAFSLEGFESEASRRQLYQAYQDYYQLIPDSFDSLSTSVKELIRQPFIMRLVAETYSNYEGNKQSNEIIEQKRIPKKLDYFRLFHLLTDRKAEDAKRLLPMGELHQEVINKELQDCLYAFAQILLRNFGLYTEGIVQTELNRAFPEESHSDSIPFDVLYKDNRFRRFVAPITQQSSITIFDMAIQVGLVEKVFVTELDYWGNKKEGRAYKFFHDQYTQYWLSAVYSKEVLGPIASSKLASNLRNLDNLTDRISEILQKSSQSPILAGALDHWLYANMCQGHINIVDYLFILLDRLAQHQSGFVRHYIGSYIYSLIEKNIIDAKTLFKLIVDSRSKPLKKLIADHVVYVWQTFSPGDFRSLIEAYDDKDDDAILRELGDILADIFMYEPQRACQLLDEALYSLENINLSLLTQGVLNRDNLAKHITFVAKFSLICVLSNSSDIEKLSILRKFLVKKYQYVVSTIVDEEFGSINIKSLLRTVIYSKLEAAGINQWDQAIGPRDHNNQFFVSYNGNVQRDILYDYFKFLVAYHNGDLSQLTLEPGSGFRTQSIKMMVYSSESVIGYVAALSLAIALTYHKEKLESIIDELMQVCSEASTYYTNVLLSSLALMDTGSCPAILMLLKDKVIPWALSIGQYNIGILSFYSIVSVNCEKLWEHGAAVLDSILNAIEATGDRQQVTTFTNTIVRVCFNINVKLGTETAVHMMHRGFLNDPLWNNCLMSCLAALYTRNPKLVQDLLVKEECLPEVEYEVKGFVTQSMIEFRNQGVYQSSWNKFIVSGITTFPKLRYYLIKVLAGGLIQSNSVEEFAKEFRRFVIETARGFLGSKDDINYSYIDLSETLSQTESQRAIGGGKEWHQR